MNQLSHNIKYLRTKKNLSQAELANMLGVKSNTISNYENNQSSPDFEILEKIISIFEIDYNTVLTAKLDDSYQISNNRNQIVSENKVAYENTKRIPILSSIEVAAGNGIYNRDSINFEESIQLPQRLLKSRDATYAAPRIKGDSMSPTLQDSGYVISRLLNKNEWAHMPNEHIFIVTDINGKSYIKRVKIRWKHGFITLMSDNPDKASYPNFNLEHSEIVNIWDVEWYISAKMPNIHDQYYNRLQRLEDKYEDLERRLMDRSSTTQQ